MARISRLGVIAGAVAAASFFANTAHAFDLFDVLPAALDQPQINAIIYVGTNISPQFGETLIFDPDSDFGLGIGNIFTISAYLDTGASGILFSTSTKNLLTIPVTSTIFSDVGVAGTDDFQVSQTLRISLAQFYPRTDLDEFAGSVPITTPYTPLPSPIRAQVGPYVPTVEDPLDDSFGDILDLILDLNSLDVVGMPAMVGKVVVMDPTRVSNYGVLFDENLDLDNLPDVTMRTYVYAPGTPYHDATKDTDPGIPATSHHVKLTYASFDRFTTVTPAGAEGPTLAHNPFIGKDPVAIFDGQNGGTTPGIKISRDTATGTLSAEGNWLLDTGAAASILSRAQAALVGVTYQAGTFGTPAPVLVDENGDALPGQFVLTIGGIGGQSTVAGFYLDELLIRTMEGNPLNDDDPNHLKFIGAPVLVGDISLKDPVSGRTLTLDGIFGMNFLVSSVSISQLEGELFPSIDALSTGYFNWITFDEPNGILGLSFDPASGVQVPEPASLMLLAGGVLAMVSRRSRAR